jgi:hypothetical protein
MIRIKQNFNQVEGEINVIILSLKDREFTIGDNLSWLIVFTNDYSKVESVCIIQNNTTSITPVDDKYAVRITEKTNISTVDNTSGEIKLSPVGSYSYEIYQQDSITNKYKDNAVVQGLVESGKAYLSPYSDTQKEVKYTQYTDTDNDTNYIYVE